MSRVADWPLRKRFRKCLAAYVIATTVLSVAELFDVPGVVQYGTIMTVQGDSAAEGEGHETMRFVSAAAAIVGLLLGGTALLALVAVTRPPLDDMTGTSFAAARSGRVGRDWLLSVGLSMILDRALIALDVAVGVAVFRVDGGPLRAADSRATLAAWRDARASGAAFSTHVVTYPSSFVYLLSELALAGYIMDAAARTSFFRSRRRLHRRCATALSASVLTAYVLALSRGFFNVLDQPAAAAVCAVAAAVATVVCVALPVGVLVTAYRDARRDLESDPVASTVTRRRLGSILVWFTINTAVVGAIGILVPTGDSDPVSSFVAGLMTALASLVKGVLPSTHFILMAATTSIADAEFSRRAEAKQAKQRVDNHRLIIRYVCHEVRVPLNALAMGIELVSSLLGVEDQVRLPVRRASGRARPLPPSATGDRAMSEADLMEARDTLQHMFHGAQTMSHVLNDVLTVSTLEEGRMQLTREPFDAVALAEGVVGAFRVLADQNGVALILETRFSSRSTESRSRLVLGDESRLGMVLRNLVSNALKFTPSGGAVTVTVHVSDTPTTRRNMANTARARAGGGGGGGAGGGSLVSLLSASGRPPPIEDAESALRVDAAGAPADRLWVAYEVRDTGDGIDPAEFGKLFQAYQQLASGAKHKEHSTGLGLSICKRVVRLHGGEIGAWSDGVGSGACFWCQVPLSAALDAVQPPAQQQLSAHRSAAGSALPHMPAASAPAAAPAPSPAAAPGPAAPPPRRSAATAPQPAVPSRGAHPAPAAGSDAGSFSTSAVSHRSAAAVSFGGIGGASAGNGTGGDGGGGGGSSVGGSSAGGLRGPASGVELSRRVSRRRRSLPTSGALPKLTPSLAGLTTARDASTGARRTNVGGVAYAAAADTSVHRSAAPGSLVTVQPRGVRTAGARTEGGSVRGPTSSHSPVSSDSIRPGKSPPTDSPRLRTPHTAATDDGGTRGLAGASSWAPLVRSGSGDETPRTGPGTQHARLPPLRRTLVDGAAASAATAGDGPLNRSSPTLSVAESCLSAVPTFNAAVAVALVVDDSFGNRRMLQRMLQRMGVEVHTADDGLQGVQRAIALHRTLADEGAGRRLLVTMDGSMPVMGGVEATGKIVAACGADVRVVAVTGNAMPEDRAAFLRAGATEVLNKPLSSRELARVLAAFWE